MVERRLEVDDPASDINVLDFGSDINVLDYGSSGENREPHLSRGERLDQNTELQDKNKLASTLGDEKGKKELSEDKGSRFQ